MAITGNGFEKPRDIGERTFNFAVRIVKLCQRLDQKPGVSRTLANQLLRSGTSIGANIQEAQAGQSKADFISKNAIALKEARESHYWLKLLAATDILSEDKLKPLYIEADELIRIISKIIVTSKSKTPN